MLGCCTILILSAGCLASSRARAGQDSGKATSPAATKSEDRTEASETSGAQPVPSAGQNASGSHENSQAPSETGTTDAAVDSESQSADNTHAASSWTAQEAGSKEASPESDAARKETLKTGGSGGAAGSSQSSTAPIRPKEGEPGSLILSLRVDPAEGVVGSSLVVEVSASTAARVVDTPITLAYDPALLGFLDASQGHFLDRDGSSAIFLANGTSQPGRVLIGLGRADRAHGVSGSGVLCRVRFLALASGEATLRLEQAMAWGESGVSLPTQSNSILFSIR